MNLISSKNFRVLGFVEAVSFLVLLFVAMPLKYWAHFPQAVSVVGALHGAIFVIYIVFLVLLAGKEKWRPAPVWGAVAAAILPFGPFVFDRLVLSRRSGRAPVQAQPRQ